MAFGALGTDTGGSIRIPSSMCGVVGIKGTFGRVSRYGVMPLSYSLDNAGPMTRTVKDCARMFGIVAGADPDDPSAADEPVPDYEAALDKANVKGLRIGVPTSYFYDDAAPSVRSATAAALDVYRTLGAISAGIFHSAGNDTLSLLVLTTIIVISLLLTRRLR